MQDIYNILAGSIRKILDNWNSRDIQDFNSITDETFINYKKSISESITELFDDNMNARLLTKSNLYNMKEHLLSFMDNCVNYKRYDIMLLTISYMDQALCTILQNEANKAFSGCERMPLNDNFKDTDIKLFPRVGCKWERASRGKNTNVRLDNYLYYLLMIDYRSVNEKYQDKHFFIESDMEFNRKYEFVTVPYSNQWNQKINYITENKHNLMHIQYTGNPADDAEFVEKKIQQARGKDIMIFPEVHGYYGLDQEVSQFLSDEFIEDLPKITILPSYWNERQNRVSILDNFGEVMSSQKKYVPYEKNYEGNNYIEDLERTNKEINIIHCEGMGRIAILICRDFLERKLLFDIIDLYKLTMILVPSFSTGNYDFIRTANICKEMNCCVLWVNSCSAYSEDKKNNFKTISFFTAGEVKNTINEKKEKRPPCEYITSRRQCNKECMFEYEI